MDLKKLYIEKALYPAMALLQKNRVVDYTKALQASEQLDPAQRRTLLHQRLTELMLLCQTRVPAYSRLAFTDLELRREPLDCLQAVDPILLVDFLEESRNHLVQNLDLAHLLHRTDHVGDQPMADLYMTQSQVELYEAARWRGLSWYGVTYGSPSVLLWDTPRSPYQFQEEPYMKNRLSLSVCAMTERSVPPTLLEIDSFQPEYITGSANALATLADHMEKTGLHLQTQLKVVTVTRGVADRDLLKKLSQAYGCPAAQVLANRTGGLMAYMCPEGHLHITAENCFIELLDPKTWTPVAPGQRGLVTVTNLLDETMPHLRVILDYMAAMPETLCPCGRTLPVLEDLQKIAPA